MFQKVLNNSTGKKLGDRPIGRLPAHIDPEERTIVIQGTSEAIANPKPPRAKRMIVADHPSVGPLSDMMERPIASPVQAPMNRAARRRAARQQKK